MTRARPHPSRRHCLVALAATLGAFGGKAAFAQAPGARAMRFISAFPPGTGADLFARWYAARITDITGQAVVVENKPGANGFIAIQALLSAPADGQNVLFAGNSAFATNAALFKKLPYDPLADFAPVGVLAGGPFVAIVPADSPFRSWGELVQAARKDPGKLNYGAGSASYYLNMEWLSELAGIKATHVPFKGTSEVVTAVLGKTVDYGLVDITAPYELLRSGKLRALLVSGDQRLKSMPAVPTARDLGMPDYQGSTYAAAVMSSKAPAADVERVVKLFGQVMQRPDSREFYAARNVEEALGTPEDLRRRQELEITQLKRLAQQLKIELQ